jgi:glycosyltransferase involved in cell wall biosynthesis
LVRSAARSPQGVAFVGPAAESEGGIAVVLKNYARTRFWEAFDCALYPTSAERSSAFLSIAYQIRQMLGFVPWLLARAPRVVSIHTSSRRSFYRSFVYLLMARLCTRPVVLHIHPVSFIDFHTRSTRLGRWMIQFAIDHSDQVVLLSDGIRSAFTPIEDGTKVIVIPNPVDITEYRRAVGKAQDGKELVVLFMGWIIREKGVYDLVEAIPQVISRVPGARFVFAGNKEVERLRDMLRERHLDRVAEVVGWVSGEAKLKLLRESHLLVLPSYTEGVPNVLLEAMAAGLPVLTTPVGGIPSIVEDGKTGAFVAPGDVPGLAAAITRLLLDPGLRGRLSTAARASMEAGYSLESVGRMLATTYGKYMDPSAGPLVRESGSR